jgi:carbon-monoxide dehydrogenase medium subunit
MALFTEPFRPREYLRPKDLEGTFRYLEKYGQGARILAGGTQVFVDRNSECEVLIDIGNLPLAYIKGNGQELRIGAGTTIKALERASELRCSGYKALVEAAEAFGTPQLRNVATIGGNICYGVPSADFASPLMALDAQLVVEGPRGKRTIALREFFLDVRKTEKAADELALEFVLPPPDSRASSTFQKKSRVTGDISLANVAVCLTLKEKGNVMDASIVLGAVGPTPIKAIRAESFLKEKMIAPDVAIETGSIASEETKPITDQRSTEAYRREISKVLVQRALLAAAR